MIRRSVLRVTTAALLSLPVGAACILLGSAPAGAASVTYGLTSGTVQLQASTGSGVVFDATLALSTDSFVVWDSTGVPTTFGAGTIDDLLIRAQPGQGPYSFLSPYGLFDQIAIQSADILPVAGFSTLLSFLTGASTWSTTAGPVAVDAIYSAGNSGPGPSLGPTSASITNGDMTGTLTTSAGDQLLSLAATISAAMDGTDLGEPGNDLQLSISISFFGDSTVVPTPEPTIAFLLAIGLAGLSLRRRGLR